MTASRYYPLAAALVILTGCAHQIWYQPGVSQNQADRDEARGKLLYSATHTDGNLVYQAVESGNFVDNYMMALGYHRVPASQAVAATNAPARVGIHAE